VLKREKRLTENILSNSQVYYLNMRVHPVSIINVFSHELHNVLTAI
jgi:hypothetical protein